MSYAKHAVLSHILSTDTIITADRQLSGKGRWGRNWESSPGNLYYTRVFPQSPTLSPFSYSQLGALAVLQTAQAMGCAEARIKWPNDILVQGKKMAGILIERFCADGVAWISTGIGMNVNMDPHSCLSTATSLTYVLQKSISLETVLDTLQQYHTEWLKRAQDHKVLQQAWQEELSWMKGTRITTHRQSTKLSGIVHDFLEDGSVTLGFDDGSMERVYPEWIEVEP